MAYTGRAKPIPPRPGMAGVPDSRPYIGPTSRLWRLWFCVLALNVIGAALMHLTIRGSMHETWYVFWFISLIHPQQTTLQDGGCAVLLALFATSLMSAPFIGYLSHGWFARFDEFRNSLKDGALFAYLRRFWSASLLDAVWYERTQNPALPQPPPNPELELEGADSNSQKALRAECMNVAAPVFERLYYEQYGLKAFVPPWLLLIVITYLEAVFVAFVLNDSDDAYPSYLIDSAKAISPEIIGATAGAFLFSITDAVMNIRRRSLNVSDIYWYAARAFLAVPIGYYLSHPLKDITQGGAVPFAIMILPIDVLMKQIRRVAYTALSADQKEEEGDQLLTLTGVTSPIVTLLLSEGVYSVEQIATSDPVLLSIRTGLPFRFMLRLGSQAIVRRHLGDAARYLASIGYADAASIYELYVEQDFRKSEYDAVCAAIKSILTNHDSPVDIATVTSKIRSVAGEEYTQMVVKICPITPPLLERPPSDTTTAP